MRKFNARSLLFHVTTAGLVAVGVSGLLAHRGDAPGWVYGLFAFGWVGYVAFRMRRSFRRVMAPPPPSFIADILAKRVVFYQRLDDAEKARFCREVDYFLLDQNIVGVNAEVDDTLRVLTASSAVLLSFGLPDYEWDTTRDILIYPTAYTENYEQTRRGTRLGQVRKQGPIILSAEALHAGFAKSTDGHNVGIHEFAHILDVDDGEIDGIPANLNWQAIRPWLDTMNHHMQRSDKNNSRRRVLRAIARRKPL